MAPATPSYTGYMSRTGYVLRCPDGVSLEFTTGSHALRWIASHGGGMWGEHFIEGCNSARIAGMTEAELRAEAKARKATVSDLKQRWFKFGGASLADEIDATTVNAATLDRAADARALLAIAAE